MLNIWIHSFKGTFSKELLDLWRDKRFILTLVLAPILVPVLVGLILVVLIYLAHFNIDEYDRIGVKGYDDNPMLIGLLIEKGLSPVAVTGESERALRSNSLPTVIEITNNVHNDMQTITIYRSNSDFQNIKPKILLDLCLAEYREALILSRLKDAGLDKSLLEVISVDVIDVDNGIQYNEVTANLRTVIFVFLPVVLGFSLWQRCSSLISFLVLNEFEKGTLEALSSHALSMTSVLAAKFCLALCLVGLATTEQVFAYAIALREFNNIIPWNDAFNIYNIVWLNISMLVLALLFLSIQMAISVYATSIRVANAILVHLILVVSIPGAAAKYFSENIIAAIMPFTHTYAAIYQALAGTFEYGLQDITAIVLTVALATFLVIHSSIRFSLEKMLLSST